MEPSAKNSWDEALIHLPAYQKYKQFDPVDISEESISQCNNIGSEEEGDKTFCRQIVQNLTKLSTLSGDQIKNRCYYFQYWLFENIAKNYYNGNESGSKYSVAQKLFDIVSTLTLGPTKIQQCHCYLSGKPDDWKEEKYFHDYFENYDDIKCKDSVKSKCEKYVKYVTYIKTIYGKKNLHCCNGESYDEWHEESCKAYFKCENKFNPEKLLTQLKTELESLGEEPEAPRDGGTGAVEAGKAPKSGGEPEKKAHEDEVGAGATEKVVESLAQPALENPIPVKPEVTESRKEEHESAKPVEAKFVQQESRETVTEAEAGEEQAYEGVVNETTDSLQPEEPLGTQPIESIEQGLHAISSNTTELASSAVPLTITNSTKTLGTTHEEFDSNFFRKVIMAISILGTIFYLFYYNRSSRLESSSRKKKRKKGKMFEHNYYEEYEKELATYDSEETFLDSETDRLYLNYHADQDSVIN